MLNTRVVLAGLWVAVMLTYLLGDVLRIFAGDFEPGKLAGGFEPNQVMWVVIAVLMLIPIIMLVLTLVIQFPAIRIVNIAAAIFMIVFCLVGLPYPGAYDNFLIAVSVVIKGVVIWYAWRWVA
jgi:hypothetical protein